MYREAKHMKLPKMKELREKQGLTQKGFGDIFGVSEATVSNYENGKRDPDLDSLCQIADYFDVSLDMLVRGKEKTRPNPASIRSKMDKLTDLYLSEVITKEDYLTRYEPLKTALKDAESAPKPVPPEVVKSLTASYDSWSRAARKAFWSRLLVKIIPQEDGTFRPYFDRSDNEQLLLSFIVKMSTN